MTVTKTDLLKKSQKGKNKNSYIFCRCCCSPWPAAIVGVRAGGLVAWQSPTTSRVPVSVARARYVVGVAKAADPTHNTQQRQSAGFVNFTPAL